MPIHTFPITGPLRLFVRIGHGQVTVETADDLAEATITVEPGTNSEELAEQTTVELRDGGIAVVAPRQGGIWERAFRKQCLDVHALVPTGTSLKIATFTAPIAVLGTVGSSELSFGAGEAGVRRVEGDLRVRFGSGRLRAVHVTGAVQLRSGAGSAEFGEIGGALSAGTGSGDLQVRRAHGTVRARTGSGASRLGEVHGDVDVASGSGAIDIGLPVGLTAKLNLHTGSGRVQSDLPIEERPASRDGAIDVRARTGSGPIHLFHSAA